MREAASNGADVIMLPGSFTTPYSEEHMTSGKESAGAGGAAFTCLQNLAKETKTYIIGGSIPESIPGASGVCITCLCFDRQGVLKVRYRKQHLMKSDLP